MSKSQTTLNVYKFFAVVVAIQLCLGDHAPFDLIWWNNYAFPHMLAVFTLTMYLENILEICDRLWSQIPHITVAKNQTEAVDDILVDNVPTHKVLEFLFEKKWRPVIQAKEELWLTVAEHKKLWDNMERVGILVRGENNARILSDMDPEYIVEMFARVVESDQLQHLMIQDPNNRASYSSTATLASKNTSLENGLYT